MMRPIMDYLTEFTPGPPMPAFTDVLELDGVEEEAEEEAAPDFVGDMLQAARLEGIEEGRTMEAAEWLERQSGQDERETLALEAARARWAEEEADVLSASVREGFEALETRLADGLAGAIQPLLDAAIRVKTMAELRQALAELMAGAHGPLVEVRGPGDIVEALRTTLGENPAVVLTVADSPEVVLETGDTTIRSQMQAWTETLRNALRIAE